MPVGHIKITTVRPQQYTYVKATENNTQNTDVARRKSLSNHE
jgi:hypothetical protein